MASVPSVDVVTFTSIRPLFPTMLLLLRSFARTDSSTSAVAVELSSAPDTEERERSPYFLTKSDRFMLLEEVRSLSDSCDCDCDKTASKAANSAVSWGWRVRVRRRL